MKIYVDEVINDRILKEFIDAMFDRKFMFDKDSKITLDLEVLANGLIKATG